MREEFTGVHTALITPFKKGAIDFTSLKKLIRQQLDGGINGFIVSGSTAEAATLSLEEKQSLLKFVMGEVAGQVPVIVGSGTFNTAESVQLTESFSKAKPSGFLVVTPYYNKPPQRGMVEHFLKIASSTDLPIIVYNVPGRTAITLDVATVVELSKKAKNIIGIKEAAGNLEVIKKLKAQCPADFLVLSGDDATFVEAMGLGAHGVISVISHVVPKWCVEATKHVKSSDLVKKLTAEISDVAQILFCESNPIPVKWALKEMGIIESAELRLPLVEMDPKFHGPVKKALQEMGAL